jgi:hypothetical protein
VFAVGRQRAFAVLMFGWKLFAVGGQKAFRLGVRDELVAVEGKELIGKELFEVGCGPMGGCLQKRAKSWLWTCGAVCSDWKFRNLKSAFPKQ